TLNCTLALSDLLTAEGRHDRAYELRQGVLEQGRQSLPPAHPILKAATVGSAFSLWQMGRHGDSIKRYEDLLRLQRGALKPRHPDTLDTMNTLAWHLATAPDPGDRDAPRAVELAKELVEANLAESSPWNTLGVAYYRAGDRKNAIVALERAEALAPG